MKVFVDVDTLGDFFEGGALPVPDADEIRPTLAKITKFAKSQKIPILKFNDSHDGTEPEMKANGGPFPSHCMSGTEGAASIRETSCKNAVIFEKQTYDVFDSSLGNKKVNTWLKENKVTEAWVYGVVGNICVEAAVMGLLKRGIRVYIFKNAITWMDMEKGIFCNDIDNREKSITRMKKAGALVAVAKL